MRRSDWRVLVSNGEGRGKLNRMACSDLVGGRGGEEKWSVNGNGEQRDLSSPNS